MIIFFLKKFRIADPDKVDVNGITPLMRAASLGRYECAELLLKYGADPFLKDYSGKNSFDRAIFYE